MKVSKELKLHLVSFLSLALTTSLFATSGTEYLSQEQQKILEIEKEVNKKSATSLKYDWIEPIVASYSYSKSNQMGQYGVSKYFRVSFSQPVFKSGGIYFAIKYSNANRAFKDIAQKIKERNLIKALYEGVLNLKKIDLEIEKASLSIKNAKIDIQRKREQFDSGLLDSSFLDSAILKKSSLSHQLLNLKSLKFTTLKKFQNLSEIDYKTIELPKFETITKDEFISNNLDIQKAKEQKNQAKELKNMTISNYLPTISLFGDYNHKDDEIQFFKQASEYKNFGARVSMPLFAINRGRDIEIRKLEYLKAKIALKEQKEATIREFLSLENSIDILKRRIEIAKADIELYSSLVNNAKDGVSAGEKTKLDLQTLQNSKTIALLDSKIYDIKRELEILKLYEKMSDEI
jgi:outer membrane protein TolC